MDHAEAGANLASLADESIERLAGLAPVADSKLLEWADKIDSAATVEERIALLESMPPDLAAEYVEMVHPS